MTVARLESEMSLSELLDWMKFYQQCPFGPDREDYRIGLLYSQFYNANRKRGAKAIGPDDVFPSLKRQRKKQSPQQMENILMAWASQMNGTHGKGTVKITEAPTDG